MVHSVHVRTCDAELFILFKNSLEFKIGFWSSYATHTKHLPIPFFLESRQVLLQHLLEFLLASYQLFQV